MRVDVDVLEIIKTGQIIATFPAGWSPQMDPNGGLVRESYTKWPKHSG